MHCHFALWLHIMTVMLSFWLSTFILLCLFSDFNALLMMAKLIPRLSTFGLRSFNVSTLRKYCGSTMCVLMPRSTDIRSSLTRCKPHRRQTGSIQCARHHRTSVGLSKVQCDGFWEKRRLEAWRVSLFTPPRLTNRKPKQMRAIRGEGGRLKKLCTN